MLDSFERYVLLYDMHLRTARKSALMPTLAELVPALQERVANGESVLILPAYAGSELAPWLRIKRSNVVSFNGGAEHLALLFSVGDPRASNPSFEHSETANIRTIQKEEKEGKALAAHALMSINPSGTNRYRMIVEDIRGLGRTRVQEMLAKELKIISEHYNLAYTNGAGEDVSTYIIPSLEGYKSERLEESIKRGTLSGVWLQDTNASNQLDEIPGASIVRREIKIDVSDPSLLEKIASWGKEKKFDKMRLVWNDPEGAGKPERASVDITQTDVASTYFVQQHKVKVSAALDDACELIRDDMIEAMYKQVN